MERRCKTCGGEIRQADLDGIQAQLGADAERLCTTCLPCRRRIRAMAEEWDGSKALVCYECRWVIPPKWVAQVQMKVEVSGGTFHPPRQCRWCRERGRRGGPRLSIEQARVWREELESPKDRAEREAWEKDNDARTFLGSLPGGDQVV